MARRRKRSKSTGVSHDSMLDIVTNSLGLLILVATLTAFSSEGIKVTLGAPIMYEADEAKEVVRYELVEDNIYPIELDFIQDDLNFFLSPFADNRSEIANEFNSREVKNDVYEFRFLVDEYDQPSFTMTRRGDSELGRIVDIVDEDSALRQELDDLDPEDTWLYFEVRADSFDTFRRLREHMLERGFEVGWGPIDGDDPLTYSPGVIGPG